MCLESLIHIAKCLSKEENMKYTVSTLTEAAKDGSWKVRLAFAKNFSAFVDSYGKEIADKTLIESFKLLLVDSEAEVKHAAIKNIPECLNSISTSNIFRQGQTPGQNDHLLGVL